MSTARSTHRAPFIDTNVYGTFVLLEVARRFLAELQTPGARASVFCTSPPTRSMARWGRRDSSPRRRRTRRAHPYSASKAAADHLVRAYHRTYDVPALITNCSNNYGPFQHAEKLIPLTILNAIDARELPIYGDGGNVRDWLHVTDHCSGLLTVLERGKLGEQYNIGGGNEQTNLMIVDSICDLLEELVPPGSNPAMTRRRQCITIAISNASSPTAPVTIGGMRWTVRRLQRQLDWKPKYSFRTRPA